MNPPASRAHTTGPTFFWSFFGRLADGHCHNQDQSQSASSSLAPPSTSSLVWFRKICLWRTKFSEEFGEYFFGLPFVRRHIIIRITAVELVSTGVRGIIDWLFDDTDYYGGNGGGPIDGHHRCFSHRHLAIVIRRSLVSDDDLIPLIAAIRDKVSRESFGFSGGAWGGV